MSNKTKSITTITFIKYKDRLKTYILMMENIPTIPTKTSDSEYNFTDKVVIVTGSSSGIGAATALKFAQLGAYVVLIGRNLINLQNVEKQCTFDGSPKPLIIVADMTVDKDVENIIETTIMHFGKIDILINNAGILENGSIEETDISQYDRVFNVNVRAIYHLTNLCSPFLIATKGNIVNVSSVTGLRSFPGVLAYCMSKSAIDQFTKCVALELAPKGVRVNSVNPGVIVTDIHKRGGMDDQQYELFLEKCKTTHALGRAGDAQEVANTIAFLASNQASFITGANIPVDGGRHAMCPR